ncbi:MAG TPA: hypothetical protein VGR62_11105 [Candidatus Binatia bacterium]|jgi:hypothetical protein|nr:hypothetical protein [Candidatus Binatia bacterium]
MMMMTKLQAREWVHKQLIVDELDCTQLVTAFTVLAEHAPNATDRRDGLFRRCCEIVLMSVPAAPPTHEAPPPERIPHRPTRSYRSSAS